MNEFDEQNYHPTTGTIYVRELGELPKRTVGKRLGLTAFVLAWFPLGFYALILLLSFIEANVPANTGLGYVLRPLWMIGIIVVPLGALLALVVAGIGLFRPSISGKIWSLFALILVSLTVVSYIFGYFTLSF